MNRRSFLRFLGVAPVAAPAIASAASQPSAHMTALPASEVIPSPNAGECPFIYERGVVYLNPALLSPAGMKVAP